MRSEDKEEVEKYLNHLLKNYEGGTKEDEKRYFSLNKELKGEQKKFNDVKKTNLEINPFSDKYDVSKLAEKSKFINEQADVIKDIKEELRELDDKVNDTITVNFNSIAVTTKRSYLESLKDKAGYLEKRFEKRIDKLVGDLTTKGEYDHARSLVMLTLKTEPSHLSTSEMLEYINEVDEDYTDPDVYDGDDGSGGNDAEYDIIVETGDTNINIIFV